MDDNTSNTLQILIFAICILLAIFLVADCAKTLDTNTVNEKRIELEHTK